jgi:membrane-associated phospholipid phosphatase
MNINKRKELIPTISRASPALYLIIIILYCIISISYNSFYLLLFYIFLSISNTFAKYVISKPLYKVLNKTTLPILGLGGRPKGSTSCGLTLDNKVSTSFGMPSGHSQLAWGFAIYIICKLLKLLSNSNIINNISNKYKINQYFIYTLIIIICVILLSIAYYISYSRVYIEGCHTFEQVSFGGILGLFCGLLAFYFENDIILFLHKYIRLEN